MYRILGLKYTVNGLYLLYTNILNFFQKPKFFNMQKILVFWVREPTCNQVLNIFDEFFIKQYYGKIRKWTENTSQEDCNIDKYS